MMKEKRLKRLIRRGRISLGLKIALEAVLLSLLPLSLSTALFPVWREGGFAFLALSPTLFLLWIILQGPRELKDTYVVTEIERSHPFLRERLLSFLELSKSFPGKEGYSEFFLIRLGKEIRELIQGIRVRRIFWPNIWAQRSLPLSLFIAFLGIIIHPQASSRWITGVEETAILIPKPKNLVTMTFKPETLYVEALGVKERPYLMGKEIPPTPALPLADDFYTVEVRFSKEGEFPLFFQADGVKSKEISVEVVRSPVIDSILVEISYPRYTGWKPELTRDRIVSVIEDSKIRVMSFFDADSIAMVNGDSLLGVATGSPIIWETEAREDIEAGFILYRRGKSKKWRENLTILVIPDEPPKVRFMGAFGEVPLPEDMTVEIRGFAEDDIGLKEVSLLREFNGDTVERELKNYFSPILLDTFSRIVSLEELPLLPGDEVSLILRATDRKGQSARSEPLVVRVPTPAELYQAAEQASEAGEGKAESLMEKTRELSQKLERIEELLKENKKIDWAQKEKVKEILESEKSLIRDIEKGLSEVSTSLRDIEKTFSLSPELVEKIQEVRSLFEEVMTEEMRKALEELEKAVQELKPEDIRKALAELKLDQEAMKRSLERLAEILRRFKQEAELRRLAEEAKKLAEEEKGLSKEISKAPPDSLDALGEKQKSLMKELENFKGDLSQLQKDLENTDKAIADSLGELSKEDIPETEEEMQSTKSSLSKRKRKAASSSSMRASKKMSQIAKKLGDLASSLESSRLMQLAENLQKLRRQTLFLSLFQEDIVKEIERMADPDSLAHIEGGVREGTDRVTRDLVKVIQMSLLLNPRMAAFLSQASHSAMRAQEFLSNRNPQMALKEAKKALSYLNLAALSMLQAEKKCKSQCSSGGSSTGLEEAMKKLAQMAKMQASLNRETQSLMPLPLPIPREQLAQIAAQQEAIGKALRRLREELGREEGLLRGLEKASEEAEEVAEKVRKGEINKELIRKQERILARMLEVQKSIHKQEFSRRRKSTPGKAFEVSPPPELEVAKIRERIRRGLLELRSPLIPQGYRALIRAYFESLLKE